MDRQAGAGRAEHYIKDFKDDVERRKALETALRKGVAIPEGRLTNEQVYELLKNDQSYRSEQLRTIAKVAGWFAVFITVILIVAIIAIWAMTPRERPAEPPTQTDTAATTAITTGVTRTDTDTGGATGSSLIDTVTPPVSTEESPLDIVARVHGAPAPGLTWPADTEKALTQLEALPKNTLSAAVHTRLKDQAVLAENTIKDLLEPIGATKPARGDMLRNLITIHERIAALSGQTDTWPSVTELIWKRREILAEEMNLPRPVTP